MISSHNTQRRLLVVLGVIALVVVGAWAAPKWQPNRKIPKPYTNPVKEKLGAIQQAENMIPRLLADASFFFFGAWFSHCFLWLYLGSTWRAGFWWIRHHTQCQGD